MNTEDMRGQSDWRFNTADFRPSLSARAFGVSYWPVWGLIAILRVCVWLPRRVTLRMGKWLGAAFYRFNKKRRDIAGINIELCFPGIPEAQRVQMVRTHFCVYGQSVIDLGLIRWASENRLRRMVTFYGEDRLQRLVDTGDAAMLITPHSVGMDFGGVMLSRTQPTISMMKSLNNPPLDWFFAGSRTRFGLTLVLREHGLRPLIKALKNRYACYYMPDEDFGADRSIFVPFFGVPAATITTVGRMAAITGAKVVPCITRLRPDNGRYEVFIESALDDFPSGDTVADAARMNAALEALIRPAPEQYMWTLRWFKTRPHGEQSPY